MKTGTVKRSLQILSVLFAGITLQAGPVEAETIARNDVLEIRVMEWDPIVTGGMKSWAGWTTEYLVDDDGVISVPFLGSTPASEMSPAELGDIIADQLFNQLALADRPAVTVRIAERPPIFVSGLVRSPGAMEYRSGMTAREALARAGGVLVSANTSDPLRTRLEAENRLDDMVRRQDELAARSARLQAEVDDLEAINFPQILGDPTQGAVLRTREERLFDVNRKQTERRLALIDGRITLLRNEIESLKEKTAVINTQLALAEEQMASTEQLAERGLTNRLRLVDSQSRLSSLQLQSFDTRGAILQAEQEISRAQAEKLDAVEVVAARRVSELQTTDAALAEIKEDRRLQMRLNQMLYAVTDPDSVVEARVRHADGTIDFGLDTAVVPGDFLEITLPPVDDDVTEG